MTKLPAWAAKACGGSINGRRDSGGRVAKAEGGPLSTKERNSLPAKDFAGPDRSYPINDANHARNALSRVSQFGSSAEKKAVRSKVAKKFPGIGKD